MSTPTDLRHLLDARAGDVTDVPAVERLAAVHGRVRVVRRRRRASVALVALAAVLGVGVVAWLPDRGPEPLERPTVDGRTAPATMTSLGYGYRFVDSASGDGRAEVHLRASDTPRIVSWAGSGRVVRLVSDRDLGTGTTPYVSDRSSTGFDDFVVVPTGQAVTLRATGTGPTALAVYAWSRPAPGLTADGVTWRDSVAGGRRIAAAIGRPGQSELTTSFTMPAGSVSYAELCAHAPAGTWFHVSFDAVSDDSGLSFGECDRGAPAYDAAGGSTNAVDSLSDSDGRDYRPGETVPVRVWATRGEDGPLVDDPRLMIAAGFYAVPAPAVTVGDYAQSREIEADGHLWRFARVDRSAPSGRRLSVQVSVGGTPVLLRAVAARAGRGDVTAQIVGQTGMGAHNATAGGSATLPLGEVTDRTVTATVTATPGTSRTELAVLTYQQAG